MLPLVLVIVLMLSPILITISPMSMITHMPIQTMTARRHDRSCKEAICKVEQQEMDEEWARSRRNAGMTGGEEPSETLPNTMGCSVRVDPALIGSSPIIRTLQYGFCSINKPQIASPLTEAYEPDRSHEQQRSHTSLAFRVYCLRAQGPRV